MFVENNDVAIDTLFHWFDKYVINDKYGNPVTTVYMRLVGDAELNRARVQAIRASKELRNKLKTNDSDERVVFIPDLEDITSEQLIESILILKVKEFTQASMKEVNIPIPQEPSSEADLEKQEKHQEEIDAYETTRIDKIRELTTKKIENYRVVISTNSLESLCKEYEKLIINDLCESEMIKKFREWCVFFGSYKDEKHTEAFFSTFDELDNLPTEVKEQFLDNYQALEINIDFLKRSLEVMQ